MGRRSPLCSTFPCTHDNAVAGGLPAVVPSQQPCCSEPEPYGGRRRRWYAVDLMRRPTWRLDPDRLRRRRPVAFTRHVCSSFRPLATLVIIVFVSVCSLPSSGSSLHLMLDLLGHGGECFECLQTQPNCWTCDEIRMRWLRWCSSAGHASKYYEVAFLPEIFSVTFEQRERHRYELCPRRLLCGYSGSLIPL